VNPFVLLHARSGSGEDQAIVNDAFDLARARNPQLRLLAVAPDCESELLQGADLLVCLGTDPAAAIAIPRAQALGLPVLVVDGGQAAELVESGRSGVIAPASAVQLSDAIRWLARRAPVRARLRAGGLLVAGTRVAPTRPDAPVAPVAA